MPCKNFETWSSVQQIIIKKRDKYASIYTKFSFFACLFVPSSFLFFNSTHLLFFLLFFFLSSSFFLSFFSCVWMKMERHIEFFFFVILTSFPIVVCMYMYVRCLCLCYWKMSKTKKQKTTKINRYISLCCFSTIWYNGEILSLFFCSFFVHCLCLSLFSFFD
jgi:hypothetical protein